MKVLFLNNVNQQCGVYQYGKRLYDILKTSKPELVNYIYIEISCENDYVASILNNAPGIHSIIYNYHVITMSWLTNANIQRKVKNIGILHESPGHLFDIMCSIDPTEQEMRNKYSIPRPIYENVDKLLQNYTPSTPSIKAFIEYSEEGVPIFGSFGFGFLNKGFDKIVKIVNDQCDAAIIKFIVPGAHFDGNRDVTNSLMEKMCHNVPLKPAIKLMITHEFVSNEDILLFLKSNTMNIFLYDDMHGRGISSTIDYALSVKIPLGISNSYMFRHIYSDKICLYKNSIAECMQNSVNCYSGFLEEYSNNKILQKFEKILFTPFLFENAYSGVISSAKSNCSVSIFNAQRCKRGVFYNSRQSLCSIWESGKMCYDALKNSTNYSLEYSEETRLDNSYDFAIFNEHHLVNYWMTSNMIKKFNKPTFCIVTEVTFGNNPIGSSPDYFGHYIVLDSTIEETDKIHAFGRPIEDFDLSSINSDPADDNIPKIFSFGFATPGKEWHKIVEAVQNEYDAAKIHFNIPDGTHVGKVIHDKVLRDIRLKCKYILRKPGIGVKITSDNLTKTELIKLCSTKTLNCFFYNREHLCKSGLAAVPDQAIASGVPLLITQDRTFRHIHTYLDYYPNIGIKQAIEKNRDGVLKMKRDWSQNNFLLKFEKILSTC
jgi:hypothetical protein